MSKNQDELWLTAVRGIKELPPNNKHTHRALPTATPPRQIQAYSSRRHFEMSSEACVPSTSCTQRRSDAQGNWAADGVPAKLLRQLRNGRICPQATLDLHGMTCEQAALATDRFLSKCRAQQLRCVQLITGIGHNAPGGKGVLQDHLRRLIHHTQLGQHVLACTGAAAQHGGQGALMLWLRRILEPIPK